MGSLELSLLAIASVEEGWQPDVRIVAVMARASAASEREEVNFCISLKWISHSKQNRRSFQGKELEK